MNSKEFIKLCQKNDINEIQIMETDNYSFVINTQNEAIKKNQTTSITTYLIKAKYLNKWVTIVTEVLDEKIIDEIKEIANCIEKEESFNLVEEITVPKNNSVEKKELNNYIDKLLNIYTNQSKKNNQIKSLQQCLEYGTTTKNIINSNGLDISSSTSYYEYDLECIANDGQENTCIWKTIYAKNENEINIDKIVSSSADLSILHLNEENISSGKYKLLLSPNVYSDIISYLLMMLNGDNINKGISMLQNHLNEKLYSNKLTIIDDATDKTCPLYRTFDDEGTKTNKNILIENGVIKKFLHNNASANDANTISTANGYGDAIGYRNILVNTGNKSYEELVKNIDYGIEVTDIMISSSAKNIGTGIYSGNIIAHIIEKGKRTKAIKNAIINTNLDELLNNIIDIGNESFYTTSSIKTPYVLVDNIIVTGTGADNNEN